MVNGEEKTYKAGYTMSQYTPWLKPILRNEESHPLLGSYLSSYTNREDVRAALNIPTSLPGW